jgi:hypothetical protein
VGTGKEVRLFESLMNSELSSYQPEELMEREDQRNLLIIGGIEIFLPLRSVGDKTCVADAATVEGQPTETVMEEEVEQPLMIAQAEKEMSIPRNGSNFSARKLK